MQHSGPFVQPFLQFQSNKYYIFRACVYSLRYLAWNAHTPYFHLWPVWVYHIFPHYPINSTIFETVLLNIKCVFWFSLQRFSETFHLLRKNERDMIKNVYCCSCNVPFILVRFRWNLNFLDRPSKSNQISNFMKIRPVWNEVIHTGRRTDVTKLIVSCRDFANALKTNPGGCVIV
jgi:hypothetical protein